MDDYNEILALDRELRDVFKTLTNWQTKNHNIVLDNLENPEVFKSMFASVDAVLQAQKLLTVASNALAESRRAINASQRGAA